MRIFLAVPLLLCLFVAAPTLARNTTDICVEAHLLFDCGELDSGIYVATADCNVPGESVLCVDGDVRNLNPCDSTSIILPDNSWAYIIADWNIQVESCGDFIERSPGKIHLCDSGNSCLSLETNTRRRQLFETTEVDVHLGTSFAGHEEEFQNLIKGCENLTYQVRLHVTDHLAALVSPLEEAAAAGCPHAVVQSVMTNHPDGLDMVARKEILLWTNRNEFETRYQTKDSISIGSFHTSELLRAFQAADAKSNDHSIYDIIQNNCGNFMLNMASELGIKIAPAVSAFVVRRLVEEAGQELVDGIRNSAFFASLFPRRDLRAAAVADTLDDVQLVELLVKTRVSEVNNDDTSQ